MFHGAFSTVPGKRKATGEAKFGNWFAHQFLSGNFGRANWSDICCRFVKGNQLGGDFQHQPILGIFMYYHLVLRYFCSWKDWSISYFSKLDSPRFSTTKRAFDDFLRTIRELKKLRCCWDLWKGENWKKNNQGASVDVLCMWLLVGFLWKCLYVIYLSIYICIYTRFTIYIYIVFFGP